MAKLIQTGLDKTGTVGLDLQPNSLESFKSLVLVVAKKSLET